MKLRTLLISAASILFVSTTAMAETIGGGSPNGSSLFMQLIEFLFG